MVETPTLAALFSRRAEGSAKAEAASGRPGLASSWPTSPPEKPRLGFFSGVTGRLLAVLLFTKRQKGSGRVSGLLALQRSIFEAQLRRWRESYEFSMRGRCTM
jgi:hypothetical protein